MYKFKKTTHTDILRGINEPFPGMFPFDPNKEERERTGLIAAYLARGGTIEKGPTKWAKGALVFRPGWDKKMTVSSANVIVEGGEYAIGKNSAGCIGRDALKDSDTDSRQL